jgi:hypothetical protein
LELRDVLLQLALEEHASRPRCSLVVTHLIALKIKLRKRWALRHSKADTAVVKSR